MSRKYATQRELNARLDYSNRSTPRLHMKEIPSDQSVTDRILYGSRRSGRANLGTITLISLAAGAVGTVAFCGYGALNDFYGDHGDIGIDQPQIDSDGNLIDSDGHLYQPPGQFGKPIAKPNESPKAEIADLPTDKTNTVSATDSTEKPVRSPHKLNEDEASDIVHDYLENWNESKEIPFDAFDTEHYLLLVAAERLYPLQQGSRIETYLRKALNDLADDPIETGQETSCSLFNSVIGSKEGYGSLITEENKVKLKKNWVNWRIGTAKMRQYWESDSGEPVTDQAEILLREVDKIVEIIYGDVRNRDYDEQPGREILGDKIVDDLHKQLDRKIEEVSNARNADELLWFSKLLNPTVKKRAADRYIQINLDSARTAWEAYIPRPGDISPKEQYPVDIDPIEIDEDGEVIIKPLPVDVDNEEDEYDPQVQARRAAATEYVKSILNVVYGQLAAGEKGHAWNVMMRLKEIPRPMMRDVELIGTYDDLRDHDLMERELPEIYREVMDELNSIGIPMDVGGGMMGR